jgi:hypothetical protein
MNPRHRYLLRALLGPAALLLAAGIAYVVIRSAGLDAASETRWLVIAAILVFVLMLVLILRVETSFAEHARVRNRERSLVEQQRAYDRLHSGVQRLRTDPGRTRWLQLAEQRRVTDPTVIAGWERRYQELLAHPTRRTWAAAALRGHFPTDAEIDYETDPNLLLTCSHLQPIESALRAAGVYCSALSPTTIVTFASLHFSKARRQFGLPPFLEWEEIPATANEPGTASIVCRPCQSRIQSGTGEPFPP